MNYLYLAQESWAVIAGPAALFTMGTGIITWLVLRLAKLEKKHDDLQKEYNNYLKALNAATEEE